MGCLKTLYTTGGLETSSPCSSSLLEYYNIWHSPYSLAKKWNWLAATACCQNGNEC